ncbi:SURF1 family protein [Sphingomonas nostoxanthinifaciens]|nr:SURF1 family protein [Sphingomonas nostoxanthinifaciens]
MVALCLFLIVAFLSLGVWQIERRAGKLALIHAVEERAYAAPTPAPPPAAWSNVTAVHDAYRRVVVHGTFLAGRDTLVRALTEEGAGSWVMTPLRSDAGFTVLVNRGFVPEDVARQPGHFRPADGPVSVTGLLRISEPKGALLRANQPANDRWFSRDVAAIAAARKLGPVAPYFIDAGASPDPAVWPHGGLTVLRFPNNHLMYAITWFGLAALSLAGLVKVVRAPRPPAMRD